MQYSFFSRCKRFCLPFLLLGLCLLTYASGLGNDFFVDDFMFVNGKYTNDFRSLSDFFTKTVSHHYIPIYYLFNMTVFELFESPLPLRLINLLLFYIDGLLLFALLYKLTRDFKLSVLTCVLFVVHPMNADIVNWITKSLVFISAILVKISFLLLWSSLKKNSHKTYKYVLSLIIYAVSLLTFETAILFPVYFGCGLYFLTDLSKTRILKICGPFLMMSVVHLMIFLHFAGSTAGFLPKIKFLDISFASFIATTFSLVLWYLGNLFVPLSIVTMKNLHPISNNLALWNIAFFSSVVCLVAFISFRWKKNLISFSLIWFLIGLSIVVPASLAHAAMGLVIVPQWLYIGSIGAFLLIAMFLMRILKILPRPVGMIVVSIVVVFLIACSQQYNAIAKTEKSYCQFWLKHSPGNTIPAFRLGELSDDPEKALAYYKQTLIRGNDQINNALTNMAYVHYKQGDRTQAKEYALKSLKLDKKNGRIHNLLGLLSLGDQKKSEAESHFLRGTALNPPDPESLINLIFIYFEKGQHEKVDEYYSKLSEVTIHPYDLKRAMAKISASYLKAGNAEKAFELIQDALGQSATPENYTQFISEYLALGATSVAKQILEAGIKQYPRETVFYLDYGSILANEGQLAEAITWWEKGLAMDPKDTRFKERIQKAQALLR